MDFSAALVTLKNGHAVWRDGWPEAEHLVLAGDVIVREQANGNATPWLPTQPDLLAADWTWEGAPSV